MSQRLIVLDEAEEELIEAEKWYERQRPGLGREFRTAIDEGMERLLEAPLAASPIVNVPGGRNGDMLNFQQGFTSELVDLISGTPLLPA